MTHFKKKLEDIFSIKKVKENPFSLLNELMIHRNPRIILMKERKLEWASEYFLIYNSDNADHN